MNRVTQKKEASKGILVEPQYYDAIIISPIIIIDNSLNYSSITSNLCMTIL